MANPLKKLRRSKDGDAPADDDQPKKSRLRFSIGGKKPDNGGAEPKPEAAGKENRSVLGKLKPRPKPGATSTVPGPKAPGPRLSQVLSRIDEIGYEHSKPLADLPDPDAPRTWEAYVPDREPANEEENRLFHWARHLSPEGRTFERCPLCDDYQFFDAHHAPGTIVFTCGSCGQSWTLRK